MIAPYKVMSEINIISAYNTTCLFKTHFKCKTSEGLKASVARVIYKTSNTVHDPINTGLFVELYTPFGWVRDKHFEKRTWKFFGKAFMKKCHIIPKFNSHLNSQQLDLKDGLKRINLNFCG